MALGDVGEGGESVLQHEPSRAVSRRKVDGDGATERIAHEDSVSLGDADPRGEPATRRPGVGDDARDTRRTLAPAVSPIVEDQHRTPQPVPEESQDRAPSGDVPRVPLRVKDHRSRSRRCREPTVQAGPVGCIEPDVLKCWIYCPIAQGIPPRLELKGVDEVGARHRIKFGRDRRPRRSSGPDSDISMARPALGMASVGSGFPGPRASGDGQAYPPDFAALGFQALSRVCPGLYHPLSPTDTSQGINPMTIAWLRGLFQ